MNDPWWFWPLLIATFVWCNRRADWPDAMDRAGERARSEQTPARRATASAEGRAATWRCIATTLLVLALGLILSRL